MPFRPLGKPSVRKTERSVSWIRIRTD